MKNKNTKKLKVIVHNKPSEEKAEEMIKKICDDLKMLLQKTCEKNNILERGD